MGTDLMGDRYRIGRVGVALACAVFIGAIFALYWRALDNPLVFDDRPLMNAKVLSNYAQSMFRLDLRWFAYASLGWTWALAGDAWHWYRIGNLALHAATCIALFSLLRSLFARLTLPEVRPGGRLPGMTHWSDDQPFWYAFAGTLLFAVHPVAVYGVAYLVQRSIVMATLFCLISLLCFMRGLERGRSAWYVAAALAYFVAVFSKEHALMLPAVAVALAIVLRGTRVGGLPALVRSLWLPLLLYGAVAVLIMLRVRGILGAPYEPFALEMLAEVEESRPQLALENLFPLSILTQAWLFFSYLGLWLLPNPGWMSVDLRPDFAQSLFAWPQALGPLLFVAWGAAALRALFSAGVWRLVGFAMIAPWLLFLTEFSAVRLQEPMVLYRSYLWMFALPAVLPLAGRVLLTRTTLAVLLCLALAFALSATNRLRSFDSALMLWDDAVKKLAQPWHLGAERAFIVRGLEYLRLGRATEALADFERASEIAPKEYTSVLNQGVALMNLRRLPDALKAFDRAASLRPQSAEPLVNASAAFIGLGEAANALRLLERAEKLDKPNTLAWTNRGIVLAQLKRPDEARSALDQALMLKPDNRDALLARAQLALEQGRADEALADLDRLVAASPASADAWYNRGTLRIARREPDQALADLDRALALDPNHLDALNNRANLAMVRNDWSRAQTDFSRMLQVAPDNPVALFGRGRMLAQQNRFDEAAKDFERLTQVAPKEAAGWWLRGLVSLDLKQPAQAAQSLERACTLGLREACERARSLR